MNLAMIRVQCIVLNIPLVPFMLGCGCYSPSGFHEVEKGQPLHKIMCVLFNLKNTKRKRVREGLMPISHKTLQFNSVSEQINKGTTFKIIIS